MTVPSRLLLLALGLLAACGREEPAREATDAADAPAHAAPDAPPPPPPAPPPGWPAATVIPVRFHGVYDRGPAACQAASDTRVTVTADALRFHESIGTVREVVPDGPGAIRVAADFQGEGESWRSVRRLRFIGPSLTISGEGTSLTRTRCPAPGAAPQWQLDRATLSFAAAGRRLVSLSCPAGTGDLLVNVPGFKPIGSEERLSFGAGGAVVALVADTRGDPERGGVTATAAVPAELAAILADPAGISLSYGASTSGPHPQVPAALARRFRAGCG